MEQPNDKIVIRGSSDVSLNDRFSELLQVYSPMTSDLDYEPVFNMNPGRFVLPPRKKLTKRECCCTTHFRQSAPQRLGMTGVRSRLGRPGCATRRRPVWTRLGCSALSRARRPVWTRLGYPGFRPWLQRSWLRGRVYSLGGLWWKGAGYDNSTQRNKRYKRVQKPWAGSSHSRQDVEFNSGGGVMGFGTKVPRWKRSEVTTKEDLDKDLEDYMSRDKRQLDKELDAYMSMAGDSL